ncbi:MAG: glycoside hydrolase family 127 protein [Bacteroidota bacterium]|nr:glycoside hydrolase family 127 protein [Bacteroidota bacterium]MDP4213595.1 glycoside hydrolase family 127 protein [Bacteroidota bacterium]MDP4249669.1 glycoside hydrolase family 127 protein [Bacteroidota bacterium]
MKKSFSLIPLFSFFCCISNSQAQNALQKLEPVSYSQVKIDDRFWRSRISAVTNVSIPACIDQTEVRTPRIRNFEKVAAKKGEKHEGIYYDDSDVYKAVEAIAYSLSNHPDPALEKKADAWIDKIAAAQLPDGYLNTYYTLGDINKRWTDMDTHEDYCAGHLIEAAVAYYHTTGKRKLLDVAIRFANEIDSTFRLQNRHWVSGHEEIELALVKLYKTTGNSRYLDLADWYLQQRGHGYFDHQRVQDYCQNKLPVKEQTRITGHAVRAMYLYTGAADVAAAKNDSGYMGAMKQVWDDVVYRNMYITGGIGSSGRNEGFTADYDLPNEEAYCETCASVGMVFWNQRMNLLTGESKYMDVLEKSLYNAALDGLSFRGDRFFYGNPLSSAGGYERSEWFGTACCPANIARLIESLGNYIYAKSDNDIWVNLFVGSNTAIDLKNNTVQIALKTNYPWDGDIQLAVSPQKKSAFALHIRIPGWAENQPSPGDTYQFLEKSDRKWALTVNGKNAKYTVENGYAILNREWRKGDIILFRLPLEIRKVVAIDSIADDRNKIALQRGPLMYCFEHPDNGGKVENICIPDTLSFNSHFEDNNLGGIMILTGTAPVITVSENGLSVKTENKRISAIPYFSWANRGPGQMQVWMPRKISGVSITADVIR